MVLWTTVERVFADTAGGSHLDAQLLVARLVGVDASGNSYAAALEIGDRFCRIDDPQCHLCPLGAVCLSSRVSARQSPRL